MVLRRGAARLPAHKWHKEALIGKRRGASLVVVRRVYLLADGTKAQRHKGTRDALMIRSFDDSILCLFVAASVHAATASEFVAASVHASKGVGVCYCKRPRIKGVGYSKHPLPSEFVIAASRRHVADGQHLLVKRVEASREAGRRSRTRSITSKTVNTLRWEEESPKTPRNNAPACFPKMLTNGVCQECSIIIATERNV